MALGATVLLGWLRPGPVATLAELGGGAARLLAPDGVPIYSKERPLDVSFSIGEVPIVSQGVAELIEKLSPRSVQRIPARMEGAKASYEILSLLANVRPEDLLDRAKAAGAPVGSGDLGQHRIARVGSAIVVARELATALAAASVTGIRFEALKGTDLK